MLTFGNFRRFSRNNNIYVILIQCILLYSFYCESRRAKNIGLFGSWVTSKATPESDIDLIIEFDQPIGFQFIELCHELERILGKKIDVLTPVDLANIRINSVKKQIEQQIIYV
jgi:predicted nucleotidyltransferase